MIEAVENFTDALSGLQRFIMEHAAALPVGTREQLLEFANHPSPVERIVNTAEALYAIKPDLSKEGREITAQLAQFAAIHGFHGMGERGQQIAMAMNRIGGYAAPTGISWPEPEDDPAPLDRFLPREDASTSEPAVVDDA